jgi:hypothetical protein
MTLNTITPASLTTSSLVTTSGSPPVDDGDSSELRLAREGID